MYRKLFFWVFLKELAGFHANKDASRVFSITTFLCVYLCICEHLLWKRINVVMVLDLSVPLDSNACTFNFSDGMEGKNGRNIGYIKKEKKTKQHSNKKLQGVSAVFCEDHRGSFFSLVANELITWFC